MRIWPIFVATLTACVGTSTGNPVSPPEKGDLATGGNCENKRQELASLDAVSPLGFSAADMLALAPAAELDVQWAEASGAFRFGPESGVTKLSIEVTPRTDKPRFNDRAPKQASGGPEPAIGTLAGGDGCPDQLELDVTVHLRSAGGAFDEQLETTLTAQRAEFARVYQQLTPAKLRGAFQAQSSQPNTKLNALTFALSFSELGTSGNVQIMFETRSADSVGQSAGITVARWPAGSRCREGFEVPLDRELGELSPREVMDRVNAAQLQAAGKPLSLQLTAAPDAACALPEGHLGEPGPLVIVPAALRVLSDEPRIDGNWPTVLTLHADEARLSYDNMAGIIGLMVPTAEFATRFGVSGVALDGFDEAAAFVQLKLPAGAAASGTLNIYGSRKPKCEIPPPPPPGSGIQVSAPGCPGIDLVQVMSLPISEN